ncbi:uncharacterized protein LOC108320413 isoform X2 [Vigna angularis]|uniref:uncharacterized protein LOC108320413 isoform X2 n=1 Tax=Phaseolus angularis TaxID=3914 RepID=UPI0022B3117C|nr:uncharacterized protein LOC108320413 isoform X2 [Vigna angularis]
MFSAGFLKTYSVEDLGKKLRMLRPEGKEKGWFSVRELSERLMKSKILPRRKLHGLSILNHLSGTPTFSLEPPKPHLVEKYFHPDNMSSAEKMKTELAKVRDEFKMSESDCGSARVQIAQLTTKIKHLSAVLHKNRVVPSYSIFFNILLCL